MRCASCDAENMEGADRCWECGAFLRKVEAGPSAGSWIIWAVLGAAAIGIAVMLVMSGTQGGGGGVAGSPAATRSVGATSSAAASPTPGAKSNRTLAPNKP